MTEPPSHGFELSSEEMEELHQIAAAPDGDLSALIDVANICAEEFQEFVRDMELEHDAACLEILTALRQQPEVFIIRHQGGRRFVLTRQKCGETSNPVELTAPDDVVLPNRSDSNLLTDLRWYLERFLEYPYEPNTQVAERIQRALEEWGKSTFKQLFTERPLLWYEQARRAKLEHLVLKISSDDPRILAWPWEALCDPHGTTLAHACRIERQLDKQRDPQPLPPGLSDRAINTLMIIARPYGDEDVGFQAVAGPLIEWAHRERMPLHIDVLRPPTFGALEERLKARPGHYHILHFDGHGGYGQAVPALSRYEYRAPGRGILVFEDAKSHDVAIDASKLAELLTEHCIPIVVLNACRSAGVDARTEDPFASTAATLLKAGLRSVVAMGYNLHVSGAQQFVPAFYQRLLEGGDVGEATRAGRQAMRLKDGRACARGIYPLQDWLVPVLYQQASVALPVHAQGQIAAQVSYLPEEAQTLGDYGFIGRQDAIQRIERALLQQPAAALLIHGIAGIGKTTLVAGFLQWLEHTGGLGKSSNHPGAATRFVGAVWLSFEDIRSAEYVINRLTEALFGHAATAAPVEEKRSAVIQALSQRPLLLVWDNFESAAGIEGTEVSPLLAPRDRLRLKELLQELRGGASKVLITSRSQEEDLTPAEVWRLPLRGLRGEDAWIYCNAVVRDLGLTLDRDDPVTQQLLTELDGHPHALRAILLQLAEVPAGKLLTQLQHAFKGQVGDGSTRRIFAALSLLDQRLPKSFGPVLQRIGLHQRYIETTSIAWMLSATENSAERATLSKCLAALERGGLIHSVGNATYSLHPALPAFLAQAHPAPDVVITTFVEFMARYADSLAQKQIREQRGAFAVHGANFQRALILARARQMTTADIALTQALAVFALYSWDFTTARRLYEELALRGAALDSGSDTHAYHQLGLIAEQQNDFAGAKHWYQKSLATLQRHGNERSAATTYHQLGVIAHKQRDFASAESWYQESLKSSEKDGNEHHAALTYHQLGMMAQERRDFAGAARWYQKALAISEKHENPDRAASTYHQLGRIAEEQRDFESAERWYQKALVIFERQGNEHEAAYAYHHLGVIAQARRDFESAEQWCHKALAISEQQGDEHAAANTYNQLGIVAIEQRNFEAAERWCHKALAIFERQGSEHDSALIYHQLGAIAQAQRHFEAAERWYQKALPIMEKHADEYGVAMIYGQLGLLSAAQGDLERGGIYALDAALRFARTNDQNFLALALRSFMSCLLTADSSIETKLRQRWDSAGLERLVSLAELEKAFSGP